jgi:acetoin utilization deacetylase AcuC-like enzyme
MEPARQQTLVASGRYPTPRHRLGENQPEKRHELIRRRLDPACSIPAAATYVEPTDAAALEHTVECGVLSAAKLDFFRSVMPHFQHDPDPDDAFFSAETSGGDGVVPYFFVHTPATEAEPMERRLGWHATDALTPIFDDLPSILMHDAAVCEAAAAIVARKAIDCYAVTVHPGHHASYDHYGGYCFLNNAVFIVRLLEKEGKHPFLVDVDYHAGDGSASLLSDADGDCAGSFVSLHAPEDYPPRVPAVGDHRAAARHVDRVRAAAPRRTRSPPGRVRLHRALAGLRWPRGRP